MRTSRLRALWLANGRDLQVRWGNGQEILQRQLNELVGSFIRAIVDKFQAIVRFAVNSVT